MIREGRGRERSSSTPTYQPDRPLLVTSVTAIVLIATATTAPGQNCRSSGTGRSAGSAAPAPEQRTTRSAKSFPSAMPTLKSSRSLRAAENAANHLGRPPDDRHDDEAHERGCHARTPRRPPAPTRRKISLTSATRSVTTARTTPATGSGHGRSSSAAVVRRTRKHFAMGLRGRNRPRTYANSSSTDRPTPELQRDRCNASVLGDQSPTGTSSATAPGTACRPAALQLTRLYSCVVTQPAEQQRHAEHEQRVRHDRARE